MKRMKLLCGIVSAVVVLGSVSAPKASAQSLSNKWFKMKFAGKGFIIDETTKNASKGTFSVPVFAQFLSTASTTSSVTYTVNLWTDTDAGWSDAFTASKTTISTNNETFFSDFNISVLGMHGNSVHGFHSPHILIKTDKTGAFKSASYDGIGEIIGGAIPNGALTNNFIGSYSLTGSTTDTNKLPFTAP